MLLLKDTAHTGLYSPDLVEDPKPSEYHISTAFPVAWNTMAFRKIADLDLRQLGDGILFWHMRTEASNLVKMKLEATGSSSLKTRLRCIDNPSVRLQGAEQGTKHPAESRSCFCRADTGTTKGFLRSNRTNACERWPRSCCAAGSRCFDMGVCKAGWCPSGGISETWGMR